MKPLQKVPAERILDAFRNDQKVTALGVPWPATLEERAALLSRPEVGRPVDYILSLSWDLYSVDRADLLSLVRPIWYPPGQYYPWTIEQMLTEYQAGRFKLPEPNSVLKLEAEMRAQFREADCVLIGYQDFPHIRSCLFCAAGLPASGRIG